MKKTTLIIMGLIILAGIAAAWYSQRMQQDQKPDTGLPTAHIKQDLCEKNGRSWNAKLEKCESITVD